MDKYTKVRKIGQGSFGCAYLASLKTDSQQQFVVIKEVALDPRDHSNALREARLLAALDHPNIVACKESFLLRPEKRPGGGVLCIVTEFADGGDLRQFLARRSSLTADELLGLFVQICLALKHLHDRKVLHRDVKPANVFLTRAGVVKLGDLGVATVLSHTLASAQTTTGTPYYTAPEICLGRRYNAKADIWSLGCVLFELAAPGSHAFDGRSPRQLVDAIVKGVTPRIPQGGELDAAMTRELQALLDDMLRKRPQERPSVNQIIRRPVVLAHIQRFLSTRALAAELDHTVLHGQHVFRRPQSDKRMPAAPQAQPLRRAERATGGAKADRSAVVSADRAKKSDVRRVESSRKARRPGSAVLARSRPLKQRLAPSQAAVGVRRGVVTPRALAAKKAPQALTGAKPRARAALGAKAATPEVPKRTTQAGGGVAARVAAFNANWAVQRKQLVQRPPLSCADGQAIARKAPVYPKPVVMGISGQALSGSKQPPPAPAVRGRRSDAVEKPPLRLRERRLEFQRRVQAGEASRASPLDDPIILVQPLPSGKTPSSVSHEMPPPAPIEAQPAPIPISSAHCNEDHAHIAGSRDQQRLDSEDSSELTLPPPMANLEFERMVLQMKSAVEETVSNGDDDDDDGDDDDDNDGHSAESREDRQDALDWTNSPPPPYSSSALEPPETFETLSVAMLQEPAFRQALLQRLTLKTKDGEVDVRADAELSPSQQAALSWMHNYISSLL